MPLSTLEDLFVRFPLPPGQEAYAQTVPWTGLEAATRAYAKIVDEVNTIPLTELRRVPIVPYQPRIDLAGCDAWIKDSSAMCKTKTER